MTVLFRGLAAIPAVRRLIELALDEDLGRGDVTSSVTVGTEGREVTADMNAREPIVAFGIDVAAAVFAIVDPAIDIELHAHDGARVDRGGLLMTVRGPAHSVLAAERTALNFAQRLRGVATLAKRYADAVAGTKAQRRRYAQDHAGVPRAREGRGARRRLRQPSLRSRLGHPDQGQPHRGVRLGARGGRGGEGARRRIRCASRSRSRTSASSTRRSPRAPEIVLLDNMTPAQVEVAAARAHGRGVLVEVSGGITLATIGDYARAGADLISVGALTHSAPAVDIGLDVRT